MIDLCCIFTTGGVILFYKAFCTLKTDLVETLIQRNLISDKAGDKSLYVDPHRIKWKRSKSSKLYFMIAYPESLQLSYLDKLLHFIKETFMKYQYPNLVFEKGILK